MTERRLANPHTDPATSCRPDLHRYILVWLVVLVWVAADRQALAAEVIADPSNYVSLVSQLRPGDTLRLRPGRYRDGLRLTSLNGTSDSRITIVGPADGSAVFTARYGLNTVELRTVSFVTLRNLTLDGGNVPAIDAVKAQEVTHDVHLEALRIINFGGHQQNVGISTKAAAWNWVVRDCVIEGAGTAMYLGDSDGSAPFVHGLIERNLIFDSIGYGLQIKHQAPRPSLTGMPTETSSTVIRHNVIAKARQPDIGFQGSRPNLLVGHLPMAGPGQEDSYEIYGNLLYQNLVGEPLFQGEGNIFFHDNILINDYGDGIWLRPHNGRPRRVTVIHNTILANGIGIVLRGGMPDFKQQIIGNAVFARVPIVAEDGELRSNVTDSYHRAVHYLRTPFGTLAQRDLRPLPGRLEGPELDPTTLSEIPAALQDFSGGPRDGTVRGAYAETSGPRIGRQPLLLPD